MKLADWMEREQRSIAEVAASIGRSAEAVRRYTNGARIPDRAAMLALATLTAGVVTANDFYGLRTANERVAA